MHRLLSSLLGSSKKSSQKKGPRPAHKRPLGMGMESLEGRKLMAAVPMQWAAEPAPKAVVPAAAEVGHVTTAKPVAQAATAAAVTYGDVGTLAAPMTASAGNTRLDYTYNYRTPINSGTVYYKVGGEIMKVTSSTPTQLLVQRAVNGVLEAHKVGDQVFLVGNYTPPGNPPPTTTQPPPSPVSISGAASSPSQVNLTWSQVSGATGYVVQQVKNNTWVTVANVSGNSYSATGLGAASMNSFRVAAVNAAGMGAFTQTANVLTWPASPVITAANAVSNSRVDLYWGAVGGTSGYWVYYQTPNGAWNYYATLAPGQTSVSVTGLSAGVTYNFQVGAFNSAGHTFSRSAVAKTLVAAPPTPTNFTVTSSSTTQPQALLQWNASAGATSYQLYMLGANNVWQKINTTAQNYIYLNLQPRTTYYFCVAAVNASGSSAASAYKSITTR